MPPLLSKLTSFFPPVITDREKANNARNLARINMRSDERVEDSIERRLACLKDLNDKKLELKNRRLKEARKRKHDGTTKMRELPADFLQKLEHYMRIGALIIFEYGVPPDLHQR